MFTYFSCDQLTMADFVSWPKEDMCHWCPGIDGESQLPDNRCLTWFVAWVKPGCKAPEYQGRSQRRVDSICEGYQIRECKAPEYRRRSQRRGCDNHAWPDVWANPESRIQIAQVSRAKPKTEGKPKTECSCLGIVSEA